MPIATGAQSDISPDDAELVDVAWDALNIGRDNKALVLVSQDHIIRCNAQAQRLFGQASTLTSIAALLGAMPPGNCERWETIVAVTSAEPVVVEVTRQPLRGRLLSYEVYAIRDLSSRRIDAEQVDRQNRRLAQQEEDLKVQNAKLDAALSNMFQGLAMFDADQRVVIANDRFAEMYGQRPEEVRPGTPLRTIIEHRVAGGLYVGTTVDEVLARMSKRVARGTASHMTAKMGDGRTIAVSIQPRADGGWVTTHQDISEREKLSERLEEQNLLLIRRESELAVQNARFEMTINNMPQGLCLFGADRRVVIANHRYAELYGLRPEQVRSGATLTSILKARLRAGTYAEPDAERVVGETVANFGKQRSQVMKLRNGTVISIVRVPMSDGSVISTHEDITEREELNRRMTDQHQQLDAALENMLQGVAMFDCEQRLIVCNRRYSEMYRLTPEQVQPGTTVRQILQYRIDNGLYHVRDSEGFVNSWTDAFGEVSSRIQELTDGRIICVTRRSIVNGGRLITHEDITDREKLRVQLEEQHRLLQAHEATLRARNLQLDAALNNMVQGLAMFDADNRLALCNRRYAEVYSLKPEQVALGATLRQIIEHRTSNGLVADRSPDEIVEAMLRRRADADFEQFYSKLSDGRCIAITVQPMADGGTVTTHHDITEQRRSEAKIAHMALHDTLTGLPNRALLNERIEQGIARVHRGEIVAIHLIDLDRFKAVNDTLGHAAGDKLLQLVPERLHGLVREADTVARMGGDEFAIVQVGISEPADAAHLALRVIKSIGASYTIDGHQVVIGASVGIAVAPQDGESAEQLMRSADMAMYRAKADGRGTFRFFERQMDAHMQERHVLERDLRTALAAGEFELYFQPIVNLADDTINGFEALIRWHHPQRGLVPPDTFIPLAEEIGLISPIGEWVIREACAEAAKWPGNMNVAVNLSPIQFRSPGLLQVIVGALAASGLEAERLELEITESVLLHDGEATLKLLYQLRELGIRIAMDDFGTGYSSLSYLQSFPFDKIKIDRSFVRDITESSGSLNIVRAIAALAKGLGMVATAEGVETGEQLAMIKSEGCTEMQGYLFSKPVPARELERLFLCHARTVEQRMTRAAVLR